MDDLERMLAEHACQRLVYSYANLLDAYEYDRFMELWADDGEWVVYGKSSRGSEAIRATLAARPSRSIVRHLVSNLVVDVESPDRASGRCYAIAYRADGFLGVQPAPLTLPRFLVDYRDEFVRDPKRGWLFSRRDIISVLEPVKN
jgi:hypothetical protein